MELTYTFPYEKVPQSRSNYVWKVKFNEDPEHELKHHFFRKSPSKTEARRFLIGLKKDLITSDLDGLTEHIQKVKEKLSQKLYILADGVLDEKESVKKKTKD